LDIWGLNVHIPNALSEGRENPPMTNYNYPIEKYDDIGGLDAVSMELPAIDRDAVEQ